MLERKNALRAQGCQIELKVSADSCPEMVLLLKLGTSSFPARQAHLNCFTIDIVPSEGRTRTQHELKYDLRLPLRRTREMK